MSTIKENASFFSRKHKLYFLHKLFSPNSRVEKRPQEWCNQKRPVSSQYGHNLRKKLMNSRYTDFTLWTYKIAFMCFLKELIVCCTRQQFKVVKRFSELIKM